MPKPSKPASGREKDEVPVNLKPYIQHRVELNLNTGSKEAPGTCPFCGKEGKFSVNKETGQYNCKVCPPSLGAGNVYTFIRRVHENSIAPQNELEIVAEERKIHVETLMAWGLTKSMIDNEWILPAYGLPGEKTPGINNLLRWTNMKRDDGTWKRRLLQTTGLPVCLFGTQFFDKSKPDIMLCEGPWDGMKLWEVLRAVKRNEDGTLSRTLDVSRSLYAKINVLAVPGSETFKDGWEKPFTGKNAMICYDNDYPKMNNKTGLIIEPAGFSGSKKVVAKVSSVTKSIRVLLWGPEGYDPSLPSGFDVKDLLTGDLAV